MVANKSTILFSRARNAIPGGVNSPVRSWKAVGSSPLFISHGKGARLFDVDGKAYLDYLNSWGALILGHVCPEIRNAVKVGLRKGTTLFMSLKRVYIIIMEFIKMETKQD